MSQDFLTTYLLNPIVYAEGYNPINTTVYAVTFVIVAYLVYKLLQRIKLKVDRRLALGISPFIVMGSLFRVLYDAGFVTSRLFVTPFIYFLIFFLTIISLFFSLFLQKKFKTNYYKLMFVIGLTIDSIAVSFFQIRNFYGAILDISFFLPWVAIVYLIKWNSTNKTVFLAQMFDATTTFTSLQFFNYQEQHVVPNIFINLFGLGPITFVPLKAIAVVAVLILIDKYSEDKQFANYLKLLIGLLGAATSLRDFTRLVAFV